MNYVEKNCRIIKLIVQRLNENKINWALTGSFNLFLQGLKIGFDRLTFLFAYEDFDSVKRIFFDYKINKLEKLANGEGEEITLLIGGVNVLFCFEYKSGFFLKVLGGEIKKEKLRAFKIEDEDIFCLKLENELEVSNHFGKKEKAGLINNFLYNADN